MHPGQVIHDAAQVGNPQTACPYELAIPVLELLAEVKRSLRLKC